MNKTALFLALILAVSLNTHAASKKSSGKNPRGRNSPTSYPNNGSPECNPAIYDCSDDPREDVPDDGRERDQDDYYNDRNTGSDYINGMPY